MVRDGVLVVSLFDNVLLRVELSLHPFEEGNFFITLANFKENFVPLTSLVLLVPSGKLFFGCSYCHLDNRNSCGS